MKRLRRPSPALVLSVIAVFVAFTGGAVAAGKISGKQIKDGSLTGKDIKNDSLTGSDIKGNVRGPEGPRGPAGPAGTGSGGSGGPAVSYRSAIAQIPADGMQPVFAVCPAGQVPTGGSYRAEPGLVVAYEQFGDFATDNPDSWMALVENPTEAPLTVGVQVACIAPGSVSGFQPLG